ncbi:MAG: sulfite exporter TauE/SafE family protein [Dehalococcoidales bacterium]|nr:sulfite exporter TauE/SafE family protein [Dehalococcoidales bacterium]MDD3264634.1 sulfite exporter TauE/SafE family protein [Dehalococcoidales bacterium]MDD4322790.1 sulfite exporter TauE/SafE family protein [Dehalococcoidales bacterium]MDD4794498.1 sulfite exporter TauE/SafE family protein [Dehalococcoidales bacterium]MDD5122183.1 sulfite exporter TauE/SafE family protein [Dehalococcoidales bacterium]
MPWFLLLIVGFLVGGFGTLIGAGGGFILVPVLLFIYPEYSPATITAITLTVTFFNSFSGTLAYRRLKRIDFKSALIFSAAGIPGAVLGANVNSILGRDVFQILFACVLLLLSAYLLLKPASKISPSSFLQGTTYREITDSGGAKHSFSYSMSLGIMLAFFTGFVAGLLGIGGGIIHVPAMSGLLSYPVHIATATSHMVISITSFSALVTHLLRDSFTNGFSVALLLSAGAVAGAQLGARYSQKVSGPIIIRFLALGLLAVAIRLIVS